MEHFKNKLFYIGVRAHMALDVVLAFVEQKVKDFRGRR